MAAMSVPVASHGLEDRSDSLPAGLGFGLATLVIGVAIGATAALLLAPQSGPELRARLAGAAEDWKAHAADVLAQGQERIVTAVESGRHGVPARPGESRIGGAG
jgi:hypothetical protein